MNKILVIGAGVSGLTTAYYLTKKGFKVSIVYDQIGSETTSSIAGALWEIPPAVCGYPIEQDMRDLALHEYWSTISYRMFSRLSKSIETGVYFRRVYFYLDTPLNDDPVTNRKLEILKKITNSVIHYNGLARESDVNVNYSYSDSYSYMAPMVDMDTYLSWLFSILKKKGVEFINKKIEGTLESAYESLRKEVGFAYIVNCAGLGSKLLVEDDTMYPVRGILVRCQNIDNNSFKKYRTAHCTSVETITGNSKFIFILPRGENTLLLGGIAEPNEYEINLDFQNESVQSMYRNCLNFEKSLHDAIIEPQKIMVGLRPYRTKSVRVEKENELQIIHNYGHGGAGVLLSWGCAFSVSQIIEQ